jgi:hypothetical protein
MLNLPKRHLEMKEYYIYNIPLFVVDDSETELDISKFCSDVEEILPHALLNNVEMVYIGKFEDLKDRNAMFDQGAIYMTSLEPTIFDMLENFVHEVAHSLEARHGMNIYDNNLVREFTVKRRKLYELLTAEGYNVELKYFLDTEYNKQFDDFLANTVGYPTLLTLTIGLFSSPYGATSIQEYFANGFEKYYLDSPRTVGSISPVLYRKIEEIINGDS